MKVPQKANICLGFLIFQILIQLEWARDCKANDYVYLGQVALSEFENLI